MYHYNFTNDLRITSLDEILKEASDAFLTDTVPSAAEDKSKNNNFMTVGFYFNLKAKGNCAKLAAKGKIRKVVLNFIKKFQFPNPRTSTDYENAVNDKILLAPMRDIVKILHILALNDRAIAYLTKEEIKNFIFYNDDLAKRKNYNLLITASQIIQYRKDSKFPQNIDTVENNHSWNQPERQIREMIKTLNYTGCFTEDATGIRLKTEGISRDNEADLFEILNCNSYWKGETEEEYQKYMDEILMLEDDMEKNNEIQRSVISSEKTPHTNPKQIIFYGVPGCGKSHKVSEMLKDEEQFKIESEEHQVVRTVFHPDYTNADFIGQILPKINEDKSIEYSFVPGPFTKILANAYKYSQNQYVLIIEEINRGNAAAIFGEIFQLFDRLKTGQTKNEKFNDGVLNSYGKGWSEYFFMNDDINHYILNQCNGNDKTETVNVNGISFSTNTGIRLPPNLSILATMNTNDQNVFTLDNAFQRRWKMEYIPNKVEYENMSKAQKNQHNSTIGETGKKWGVFRERINELISSGDFSFSNAEDKQLGLFFMKVDGDLNENSGSIEEKDFANKVLKYLWNDIFKRDREDIFKAKSFGDLISNFTGPDAFEKCFSDSFNEKLKKFRPELKSSV